MTEEKRCTRSCDCSGDFDSHSCPFAREIEGNDSEDYCTCCAECTEQCKENI